MHHGITGGIAIDRERLRDLLQRVASGEAAVADALDELRALPYEDLGFAKIDHHRSLRDGFPEVVLGERKTPDQIAAIAARLAERNDRVLVTRATPEAFAAVQRSLPGASYHETARCITYERVPAERRAGVVILSAGTADLPVAEEAAVTATIMGSEVARVYDVGVAGIHRLLDHVGLLQSANVVVVVAGMEGALPSVVGGLVGVPVIAVPTSVGYGASFDGLAALLAMLNSCAAGVSVVNIDNGFGAGYLAAVINRLAWSPRPD
jgi:NCAIR mutase (PurE)-related protein